MIRRHLPSRIQAEFDQFVLLSRDAVRSLLNAALVARDTDPSQFALWSLVLVATPAGMYAFRQLVNYSALGFQTVAVIEHAIQTDRMFFLLYGMLVAALVAAATWEALLPDRADQEILGSLPVRPRTAAAARLAAALWLAVIASAAISVPAAVLLAVAAPSHPALGFLPVVLVAHVVATMGASVFTFVLLLLARVLLALCLGAHTSERMATVLQLVTVAGLAEVFFFIPGVIPALVDRLAAGDRSALLIPPMPFAALYAWLVGLHYPSAGFGALLAPVSLGFGLVVVIAIYLWSAPLLGRRALEMQPHQHTAVVSTFAGVAFALPSSPRVRSLATFTLTTLLRSRPHRLVVTAYAGIAVAIGTMSVIAGGLRGTISFDRPEASLLAVPLVTMFFLTLGLRAAFMIPSDLDANWIFRLSRPRVVHAIDATALAMLLLSVVPIIAVVAVTSTLLGWRRGDMATIALLESMSGLALIEWALRGWQIIPFTCARAGDVEAVKSRWLGQILPMILFAFVNAAIQKRVLTSNRLFAWYAVCALALVGIEHVRRRYESSRNELRFDASASDSMATLGLSDALG